MNIEFEERDKKKFIGDNTYIYDKTRKELFLVTEIKKLNKWFFVSIGTDGTEYLPNVAAYENLSKLIENEELEKDSNCVIVKIKNINVEEI